MRSVMGLASIASGRVTIDGRDVTRLPGHARAKLEVGYMPEDRRLVPELTAEENLLVPAWATRRADAAERLKWIYGLIAELPALAPRKALSLSGGQQKLVALGRALMVGRRLALLDEPFEGVAPALAARLVEVLRDLKEHGLTILLSESDYTHSAGLVDRVFVIERGAVAEKRQ
jgi:branched-chain amino acid transport system ATP-binding protein